MRNALETSSFSDKKGCFSRKGFFQERVFFKKGFFSRKGFFQERVFSRKGFFKKGFFQERVQKKVVSKELCFKRRLKERVYKRKGLKKERV